MVSSLAARFDQASATGTQESSDTIAHFAGLDSVHVIAFRTMLHADQMLRKLHSSTALPRTQGLLVCLVPYLD